LAERDPKKKTRSLNNGKTRSKALVIFFWGPINEREEGRKWLNSQFWAVRASAHYMVV
jgi:hypothetical protein